MKRNKSKKMIKIKEMIPMFFEILLIKNWIWSL